MREKISLFIAFIFCAICSTQDLLAKNGNGERSVIIIGFDGLSSYSLNNGADMPTLRRLMAEGSSSLDVRSVLPSVSTPNWASIFMGSSPELHGHTTGRSKTPDFPPREITSNGMYPDIYWSLKQVNSSAKMGCIYEWGTIKYFVDTLSIDYIKQLPLSTGAYEKTIQPTIDYIVNEKPNLVSIIFDDPDITGHAYGWESPEYFKTLTRLDSVLKKIIDAVESSYDMNKTMIVIVSDHGGIKKNHGGKTMKEMQVPIVYYGNKIKKGHVIKRSLMVYDVTSTIGKFLKIKQPDVWISRPVVSIFK